MKNGPYELVVAPPGYPGKRYRDRYCYEHHLVWWQSRNDLPKEGEVIHKNEDKRDNRIENLELVTRVKHTIAHNEKPIRHGTLSGYRRGCRCGRCKAKNTQYMREYRCGIRYVGSAARLLP